jgi:hypothetical protein
MYHKNTLIYDRGFGIIAAVLSIHRSTKPVSFHESDVQTIHFNFCGLFNDAPNGSNCLPSDGKKIMSNGVEMVGQREALPVFWTGCSQQNAQWDNCRVCTGCNKVLVTVRHSPSRSAVATTAPLLAILLNAQPEARSKNTPCTNPEFTWRNWTL